MAYRIVIQIARLWRRDSSVIDKKQLRQIMRRIEMMKSEPWPANLPVKQLHNYRIADFRLRIGDYRVLFNKDDEQKTISLIRVLHRSKLY